MSYKIYYKFKVFKDNKGNIFVFALHGSNNDFTINRYNGYTRRSRDWRLLYQGSSAGLREYIEKLADMDWISINKDKTISRGEFLEKIMKSKKKDISEFNSVFKEAFLVSEDGKRRKAEPNDLYWFTKERYYYKNDRKEHLALLDDYMIKWLKELGYD